MNMKIIKKMKVENLVVGMKITNKEKNYVIHA